MNKLQLIATQVFRKSIRSVAWWLVVVGPLLALLAMGGIIWGLMQTNQATKVAVVAPPAVTKVLTAQKGGDDYVAASSKAAAQKLLEEDEADAMLVMTGGQDAKVELFARYDGGTVDTTALEALLTSLNTAAVAQSLGLTNAQLAQLTRQITVKTHSVTFKDGRMTVAAGRDEGLKRLLVNVLGFVMYVFLLSYGSIIAQEIATEKGSRIEESILVAVRASTQFYGKLLGVFYLLLVQVAVYAVAGLAIWFSGKHITMVKDLLKQVPWPHLGVDVGVVIVAFFLIGILSYAVLSALSGSLVSSIEQAGQAVQPALMLAMLGYIISIVVGMSNSVIITVLSYVPFLSPMIMPARFVAGQVSLGAALGSLAISVVFLIGFTWVSAKAYTANVLVYNDKGLWAAFKQSLSVAKAG